MIYGIGVDLVDVRRMEAGLARFGERLARRILSSDELADFETNLRRDRFLARRFAAKEALVKALGTGFRSQGLQLREISITHNELGKPELRFSDSAVQVLARRGIARSHLSISDERDYALAYVVLEK